MSNNDMSMLEVERRLEVADEWLGAAFTVAEKTGSEEASQLANYLDTCRSGDPHARRKNS